VKKTIFVLAALFFSFSFAAGDDESARYCPMDKGGHWTYSFFSKKEGRTKDDITCRIGKNEMLGNVLCSVYDIPSRSMTFYDYMDAAGLHVKGAKVRLLIFGLLNIDVLFKPDVLILKFPITTGDTWRYKGTASARTMAFINIDTKITADFTIKGVEAVDVNGKTFTAYHLAAVASRGWNAEKPVTGDGWIVEDIGLVKGETSNSRMELKTYEKD
jgi:hypothetical protein